MIQNLQIQARTQGGAGRGGGGGARDAIAPPFLGNSFQTHAVFTRNCVYTPNFGLKIGIFSGFAPPL